MTVRIDPTPLQDTSAIDVERVAASRSSATLDPALHESLLARAEPARANLDLLVTQSALCVTTGQQPGLFTGPLYTIYKALSAVALAERFARELGRPVVPVFWVAGDDHDLAESNHTHVTDLSNAVCRVGLPERDPAAPLTPLYKERLGSAVGDARQAIAGATPDTEYKGQILELLDRHYREDADYATAFAETLTDLLGHLGLVVFRPTRADAKRAMRPILRRTLEHAIEIDDALADRGVALAAEGRPVPVHVGDGAAPLMIEASLGRDRLVPHDGHFTARRSGERWSLKDLMDILETDPQRFSPNVLLRPVVEASILPTLAYVAGPGELAYFGQCDPLYEFLDVPAQLPVARWSGRIVEAKIAKVLDKLSITAAELDTPEGQLEARLARHDMSPEASAAFAAIARELQDRYAVIEQAAVAIDPTMRKAVHTARNTSLVAAKDLEKRLVAHLKAHNQTLVNQVAKARNNLFPTGKPQERVLNIMPYLIRYGPTLLDDIMETCRQWYDGAADRSKGT